MGEVMYKGIKLGVFLDFLLILLTILMGFNINDTRRSK